MRTGRERLAVRRRRWGLFLGAFVVLGVVLVAVLLAGRDKPGAESPHDAARRFVAAAAERDRARVASLLTRRAPADIEAALGLVPMGARATEIAVETPFGADIAFASVHGVADGRPWNTRLTLALHGGRWYVAVGEATDGRPRSSPEPP